jgi:ubiquinol-cytochrome c reductase iron-sulfur subunit
MMTTAIPQDTTRRRFLFAATAAFAATGVAASLWPLIDQMNPDAAVRASGDIIDVDLAGLEPGRQRVARWHGQPIFILNRTNAMLQAMQQKAFVSRLIDPESKARQQPDYARNWHRSIVPQYAVLVGICTYCRCVPHSPEEDVIAAEEPGYICPCCASHYDPAGRVHRGIARYNLPVPPYDFVDGRTIRIGKNHAGSIFSFASIESL